MVVRHKVTTDLSLKFADLSIHRILPILSFSNEYSTMILNGLRLPFHLMELLEARRWVRPNDIAVLANMTGAEQPEDFIFDDLNGIIRETMGIVSLWKRGYGRVYNLTSSNTPYKSANPELLDIDRAILIACNWNEEAICLDYRTSLDEPKVLCGIWPDNQGPCHWKIIAPNFESFAACLRL